MRLQFHLLFLESLARTDVADGTAKLMRSVAVAQMQQQGDANFGASRLVAEAKLVLGPPDGDGTGWAPRAQTEAIATAASQAVLAVVA